jgi:hypothetical protein
MERAEKFDEKWAGQEHTEQYQNCYTQFLIELLEVCVPKLKHDDVNAEYWECAWKGLDGFEKCMDEWGLF